MKKSTLFGWLVAVAASATAQSSLSLVEGVPALVYSLPATELVFEVEIEKTVEQPGVFYQYSQRYLATSKVVTEESVNYQLRSVRMNTQTVADTARRFAVSPQLLKGLVVNEKGILVGVNVPGPRKVVKQEREVIRRQEQPAPRPEGMLPLNQEYMMAGSTAKMAEGAAYQIYALRESRINLLSGEMDHMPADGEALKLMLQGIDRQERELTELFIGSVRTELIRHRVTLVPDTAELEKVLFRLSAKRGLVDNDDLGGEPYYVVLEPEIITPQPQYDLKAKPVIPVLYSVLPALTTVEVSDGVRTLLSQKTELPQFGVLLPYDIALLKSKVFSMELDPATGRLLKIKH